MDESVKSTDKLNWDTSKLTGCYRHKASSVDGMAKRLRLLQAKMVTFCLIGMWELSEICKIFTGRQSDELFFQWNKTLPKRLGLKSGSNQMWPRMGSELRVWKSALSTEIKSVTFLLPVSQLRNLCGCNGGMWNEVHGLNNASKIPVVRASYW